jgi:hypothetical protein
MFDPMYDQAAGLRQSSAPIGVRFVPVVLSQRDSATAFDTLWALGAGLAFLGHQVVALDATGIESAEHEGLVELLKRKTTFDMGLQKWRIQASQLGLQQVLKTSTMVSPQIALHQLAAVFSAQTIVLVLAPKDWLCLLFEDSGAQPLIPFAANPAGLVDAYESFKMLEQGAGLSPVLVPVLQNHADKVQAVMLKSLSQTIQTHLNVAAHICPMPATRPGHSGDELRQWMLKIVETALLLDDETELWLHPFASGTQDAVIPYLWSC